MPNYLPLGSLDPKTLFLPDDGSNNVPPQSLPLKILNDILRENDRAHQIHGTPSANPLRCACIVGEEAGEVMEAALMLTAINPKERRGQTQISWLAEMRKELVETASSAIRRIQLIDSGEMAQWIIDNPTQS